jgi:quercetin dioxygenase-like cupin family protein
VTAFDSIDSIDAQRIWPGVIAKSVTGDELTLAFIELEADAVVPEHSHVNEQVGMLLRGSLTFRIGGEARELGPGATWRILAHTPHDVRVGPEAALLVEAFAPARADWGGLERIGVERPAWP